jgi:hypothetical protein
MLCSQALLAGWHGGNTGGHATWGDVGHNEVGGELFRELSSYSDHDWTLFVVRHSAEHRATDQRM